MNHSKKLISALAVILAVGATPLAAQLAGVWQGEGWGWCQPYPGMTVYPWQEWTGTIPPTLDIFTGDWADSLGNGGFFRGTLTLHTNLEAYCEGEWWWFDPIIGGSQLGGSFEMMFYAVGDTCNGTWTSIWPSGGLQIIRGYK